MRSLKEPLNLKPFLDWAEHRAQTLSREHGIVEAKDGINLVLEEMGWNDPAGQRRLHRWRNESITGLAERAIIENALHRAGVLFGDVYPNEDVPPARSNRVYESQRRMTDDQVLAAHTVYVKGKLTVRSLAELLYVKYGYVSVLSASEALLSAFRSLGLPTRRCEAMTSFGTRCRVAPQTGEDCCYSHRVDIAEERSEAARARVARTWEIPPALLEQARVMHDEWGMTWLPIARALLSETPFIAPKWFSRRLAWELDEKYVGSSSLRLVA